MPPSPLNIWGPKEVQRCGSLQMGSVANVPASSSWKSAWVTFWLCGDSTVLGLGAVGYILVILLREALGERESREVWLIEVLFGENPGFGYLSGWSSRAVADVIRFMNYPPNSEPSLFPTCPSRRLIFSHSTSESAWILYYAPRPPVGLGGRALETFNLAALARVGKYIELNSR